MLNSKITKKINTVINSSTVSTTGSINTTTNAKVRDCRQVLLQNYLFDYFRSLTLDICT